MAVANDQTQLTGLFKEVYGDTVVDAFGFEAPITGRLIKFVSQEAETGNKYHQPVDLAFEHGFTYTAAGTVPSGTTVGSNPFVPAKAGVMQDAQAQGQQMYGRAQVSYEAISRSVAGAGSERGSQKKAFEAATKRVVKRLGLAGIKRLEIGVLHGGQGIGTISSVSGSSTTRAWIITDATWSPGIWAGLVGATLDVYASDLTTQRNTTGALGALTISSVNTSTKTVNVAGNSTDLTAILATDVIFFETSSGASEMSGIDSWCNLSGTWFNIVSSTYDLWNPNVFSTSTGTLSFAKMLSASSLIASYGKVKRLAAAAAPQAFDVLNTDQAALRRYDVSYKPAEAEAGVEMLTFHTSAGPLEVLSHQFQKNGLVHIFTPDEARRIGSQEMSFISRHGTGEKLILESATSAASEMRTYSNQNLFIEQPRHLCLLGGITY